MPEIIDDSQMGSIVEHDFQPDRKNAAPNLRAMGVGELLDTALSLYRRHFRSFLSIASGYSITILIWASVLFLNDSIGKTERIVIWIPTVIIIFSGFVLVVSGLILATTQAYLVGTVKMGTVLRRGGRRFFPCFLSLFLFGLLAILLVIALGALFTVLYESLGRDISPSTLYGGLVMLILICVSGCFVTYWCFFASTILVEGKLIRTSLRRCHDLIRGTWWRIAGMIIAIFLFTFAVGSILRATLGSLLMLTGIADAGYIKILRLALWDVPTKGRELSLTHVLMFLGNLSIDTFTLPIWAIGGTLLYFDQRIRKEGFDIEVMATRQREDRDARTN